MGNRIAGDRICDQTDMTRLSPEQGKVVLLAVRLALTYAAEELAGWRKRRRWRAYEALLQAGKRSAGARGVPWEEFGKGLSSDLLRVLRLD